MKKRLFLRPFNFLLIKRMKWIKKSLTSLFNVNKNNLPNLKLNRINPINKDRFQQNYFRINKIELFQHFLKIREILKAEL